MAKNKDKNPLNKKIENMDSSPNKVERNKKNCSICNHPKWNHTPVTNIDGVLLPPYQCGICGSKCNW